MLDMVDLHHKGAVNALLPERHFYLGDLDPKFYCSLVIQDVVVGRFQMFQRMSYYKGGNYLILKLALTRVVHPEFSPCKLHKV